jgi:hypothetical protein
MVAFSATLFDFRAKFEESNNNNKEKNAFKRTKIDNEGHVIYKTSFTEWVDANRAQWDKKAKESAVYNRSHYYSNHLTADEEEEILRNLDPYERIQYFENFLENKFNIDRELFQREVHDMCIAVLAHLIVGTEWKFVGKDIVKKRKWGQLVKSLSVFAMAYRRAGKTSSIQMITSSGMVLIAGISFGVFSTSKRISKVLGTGVIKMIIEAGYADMIYTKSDEIIALRMNDNPLTERSLFMSPGNPDIYTHYSSQVEQG